MIVWFVSWVRVLFLLYYHKTLPVGLCYVSICMICLCVHMHICSILRQASRYEVFPFMRVRVRHLFGSLLSDSDG